MTIISRILGWLLILVGLLWIGQGTGYFPYPAESFMIAQTKWAYWGVVAVVAGLAVLIIVRNTRRRRH
ncbi:hypothetical protein A6U87_17070 [Rhizobium sp. AC44/96]|uniref:hypothetical protein n=1 Tax=Rhizobium sp. AC44/96 TaxID=1841654 RepID=UPI00080FB608|nr:hypothetical protein [Rhizobium sp. AC44/96]OCJ03657.1 hypothetical protein A6U87_17070 [Rhizobium sp. AC44/96]